MNRRKMAKELRDKIRAALETGGCPPGMTEDTCDDPDREPNADSNG